MTWDSQANFDRLHESAKMGGSFNRDIIAAFFSADWNNKPRLVRAFPEIFMPSTEWQKKRALKQAIRATHSGTMGDPMRPTTR